MASEICQIFTRALEVSKLGLWWDPLTPSKFTDELWAMTMKNEAKFEEELAFQNWHGEFDKFWPWHLKDSKMFTLMLSFWGKYVYCMS